MFGKKSGQTNNACWYYNELKDKAPKKIVDNIVKICQDITKESPTTEIAISEIIHRNDRTEYAGGKQIYERMESPLMKEFNENNSQNITRTNGF